MMRTSSLAGLALLLLASPSLAQEPPPPDPNTSPDELQPPSPDPALPDPVVAEEEEDDDQDKQAKKDKKKAKKAKKKAKKAKKRSKKVDVSGFITTQYEFRIEQNDDGQHDPDGFRIGKAIVRVKGRVNKRIGYVIEIDPRSPTLPGVMRDGYISVHVIPDHEVRIGQQKVPFGYENWLSSRELYTHHRSELSEGLGRGFTHRDIGIGLVGKHKLAKGLRLEDAIALVNGSGFGVQADDTHLKNLWGRVGLRYKHDASNVVVRLGVSGAIGDQREPFDPGPPVEDAFRFQFKRVGADLEVDHPWGFAGMELGASWDEIPADSGETELSTAYVITVAGKTPWHAGPVLKYDAADAEEFSRFTIGGYYGEPKADFRVHLGYEYWTDEFGTHDGRVVAQALAAF